MSCFFLEDEIIEDYGFLLQKSRERTVYASPRNFTVQVPYKISKLGYLKRTVEEEQAKARLAELKDQTKTEAQKFHEKVQSVISRSETAEEAIRRLDEILAERKRRIDERPDMTDVEKEQERKDAEADIGGFKNQLME